MQPRDLSEHEAYVPGRGAEEVARDLGMDPEELTKLSSNENPHGPSPDAVAAVEAAAPDVNVYPKASHTDLTERIAEKWGLDDSQVWVSAGADGSIDYLSRAFLEPNDDILVPKPGFSYYSMSARYHHGDASTYRISKDDDFEQSAEAILSAYDGERIVYATTPHNPTGSVLPREEIRTLAEEVDEQTLVVVDEAYAEYAAEPSAIDLLDEYDNLAVLRTFSKAYGLAGLRIGYAAVPSAWADAYARVNTPFAANELACRAALAAIDDEEHLERSVETARWAREYYHEELDVPTWDSGGNFVLCEVGDATAVAEATQERGVIVRDTSSFGLPECVRVSCGTREETKTAVEVLNGVVADLRPEASEP
ncbi:histidinol-phosphate transaminase [Halobellus limi]|uniref:Histidinol-phosphate aminotransferase n=1 Tax=Halobellus limi TaxID=699433 RepID=A0A1H6AWV8_9EURY|nr:histidinol-phosphate transaminase [Halobellus limi]QCC47768.1 histidinol-phosphate transaminase [Halobellus limi]SEG52276.1 histidinol-phosphate aminotransferase [Halobellus limi]